jgi:hypothetical protein
MAIRNEARRIVVVGASGFGRESLDALDAMISNGQPLEIVGVVDDSPSDENLRRLLQRGVQYLGTIDEGLANIGSDCAYVLGIGNPLIKQVLIDRIEAHGILPFTVVHPTANIGVNTSLSAGVVICAGAVISTNVHLGEHAHVNPNAIIGHDAVLDRFVSVNPGAVISGEVRIGQEVLVGASATILQNLSVGERTIVGAATLLTKDAPSDVVVKGIPGTWTTSRVER